MKKKGKKPTYKAETEEGEIFREQLEGVIKVQLGVLCTSPKNAQ
jgi:hypothetical protein